MNKYIKLFESVTATDEHEIDQLYLSRMFDANDYVRMYADAGLLNYENCARLFWNHDGLRTYNEKHEHKLDQNIMPFDFAHVKLHVKNMFNEFGLKFVYCPQWDVVMFGVDLSWEEITEHRENPIYQYLEPYVGQVKFDFDNPRVEFVSISESLDQAADADSIYVLMDSGMIDSSEAVEMLLDSGEISSKTCASIGVFKESPEKDEINFNVSYYGHVKFNGQVHGINLDVHPGFEFEDVLSEAFKICSRIGAKYAYRKISPFAGRIYDMRPEEHSSFSKSLDVHKIPVLMLIHDALGIKNSPVIMSRFNQTR